MQEQRKIWELWTPEIVRLCETNPEFVAEYYPDVLVRCKGVNELAKHDFDAVVHEYPFWAYTHAKQRLKDYDERIYHLMSEYDQRRKMYTSQKASNPIPQNILDTLNIGNLWTTNQTEN